LIFEVKCNQKEQLDKGWKGKLQNKTQNEKKKIKLDKGWKDKLQNKTQNEKN